MVSMGDINSIVGALKVIAGLRIIQKWCFDVLWPWYEKHIFKGERWRTTRCVVDLLEVSRGLPSAFASFHSVYEVCTGRAC